MVANAGVGKLGVTYKYYMRKTARNGDCTKKRDDKDILEYEVVRLTVEYLKDKNHLLKIANDLIAHHAKRTDTAILKSIATSIANAEKDSEDTTTAYIKAVSTGNSLLEKACEKRIAELAALIENLKEQQIKIEIERGETPTHEKIFEFVNDTINGDISDKEFQEQVINRLINCVYVSDSRTIIFFSFDKETPFVSLSDANEVTAEALKEKSEVLDASSNTSDTGGKGGIRTPGSFHYARFPSVRLKPLNHLSANVIFMKNYVAGACVEKSLSNILSYLIDNVKFFT